MMSPISQTKPLPSDQWRSALEFMDNQRGDASTIDLLMQAAGEGITGIVALLSNNPSVTDEYLQLAFITAIYNSLTRGDLGQLVPAPSLQTAIWMAQSMGDRLHPDISLGMMLDDDMNKYVDDMVQSYVRLVMRNFKDHITPPSAFPRRKRADDEETIVYHPALIVREYIYRMIGETGKAGNKRYALPSTSDYRYSDLLLLLALIMDNQSKEQVRAVLDGLTIPEGTPRRFMIDNGVSGRQFVSPDGYLYRNPTPDDRMIIPLPREILTTYPLMTYLGYVDPDPTLG